MLSYLPLHKRRVGAAAQACVLLCLALFLSTGTASAQTDPDELARRHFDSGAAYFEQAEYEAALREFEKSYELSARPQILLNIATIHERMGNLDLAVETLDRYLAARPEGSDTIRIRRNNIQKRLERQQATAQKEAQKQETTAPPPAAQQTPATEVHHEEAQPHEAQPSEPTTATADPMADSGSGGSSRVPAYILLGVAGATTGAAIVTGVLANGEYNTHKDNGCGSRMSCDVGGAKGLAIASTALTGVAIAAAGAGLIWFFLADDKPSHSASLTPEVNVAAAPTAAFASAHWRF